MGKGSGGGGVAPTPTKSTVTQTNLPEYAEPYYKDLMERGEAESLTPYQAYGGPRLAGFDPMQQAGFGMQVAAGTEAPAGMMGARDYYSSILNSGQGGPRAFEAQDYRGLVGGYDPGQDYKSYMDPYLEDVLGRQRAKGEEIFQEQAGMRADQRVGRGTRRGSRGAVEEAMARHRHEQRMGDLESQQRSQAYLTAQQQARDQFLKDRQARMEAAQLGGGERLQEAQYGMQSAAAAAGLDPLLFQQQMQQAGALQGVGSAQQKMDQANLDLAYQDYLNQRDFDRRQLQFMAGLLQGVPVTPQSEVYQYQAPGSFGGQMAGAGLGALGAYKMLTG